MSGQINLNSNRTLDKSIEILIGTRTINISHNYGTACLAMHRYYASILKKIQSSPSHFVHRIAQCSWFARSNGYGKGGHVLALLCFCPRTISLGPGLPSHTLPPAITKDWSPSRPWPSDRQLLNSIQEAWSIGPVATMLQVAVGQCVLIPPSLPSQEFPTWLVVEPHFLSHILWLVHMSVA